MATPVHNEPSWANEATVAVHPAKESGFHTKTVDPQGRADRLCEQERWDELCEHYLELALATPAADLSKMLCSEALGLAELTRDPIRIARAVHARILEVDPADGEAFEALADIHRGAKEGEALVELLLARLEHLPEIADKTTLLERIALAFEELLSDAGQAFDARLAAFDLGSPTPITTTRLSVAATELDRWDELAAKAAARLREAPSDVAALRLRAAFHRHRRQDAEEAASLSHAFQFAHTPGDLVAILVEMGEICERTGDAPAKVATLYERALEVDERSIPALKGLSRLYAATGAHRELAIVLERRIAALTDADAQAAVRCELASVLEKHLGEPERAAELYHQALGSERGRAVAWAGLDRIYTTTKRYADLAAILDSAAQTASTPAAAADTLVRLGEIHRLHFVRPDRARSYFEEAIGHVPSHLPAIDGIAECHRSERNLPAWIDALERKLRMLKMRVDILALATVVVEACAVEVGDGDRALALFTRWIGGADNAPGLWPRLVEKASSARGAIDFLEAVLERTRDAAERLSLHAEIGRRRLDTAEFDAAVVHFQSALAIDDRHRPSLGGLRAAMEAQGNPGRALTLLEREEETVQVPRERAVLICDIADVYQSMGDQAHARVQYARALELDPRQDRAGWALFGSAVADEDWERALKLAESVRDRLRARPTAEQVWFRRHHGKALRATGELARARKALLGAHHIDKKDALALAELAELSFLLGDWKNASSEHTQLLALLPEDERPVRARTFFRLGLIERRLGHLREAARAFDKSLAIGTMRAQSLDALIEVYDEVQDHKRACQAVEQRLDVETDVARSVELLLDLGRRLAAVPASRPRAAACFERALAMDPQSRRALVGLLSFYQETKQWDGVMQTLRRLRDIEPEASGRALQCYAMAQVCRDGLSDEAGALELFEEALDLDPTRLAAFEQIDKLYTKKRDWSALERAYRKMLRRVEGQGATTLTIRLWHALGLIYRDRLGDHARAIEAFSVVKVLAPTDREPREILAQLYDLTGRPDAAIVERQGLLELDPKNGVVLWALMKGYRARGDSDAAWCVANALYALGAGVEEASDIATASATLPFSSNGSTLSELEWRDLVGHRDLCPHVDQIFRQIAPAVLRARAEELAAKDELFVARPDLQDGGASRLGRAFSLASRLLGVPVPPLFVRPDLPGTLSHTPTRSLGAITVAGRTAIDGLTDGALAFLVGRHLAAFRPEWILRAVFSTRSELAVLFHAALSLVCPDWQVPSELLPPSRATAVMLARAMSPTEVAQLSSFVSRFREAGKVADIGAWATHVDMTVARAGLVVGGDVLAAERILRAEPQRPGDSLEDKVADLYLFATSRSYLSFRATFGVVRGQPR